MRQKNVVPFRCECGKFQGEAELGHRSGRFVCYCDDCQAFATYLGQESRVLDAAGGTEITPIPPAHIRLAGGGLELLACVRLTEKGMYRWYTSCCRSPIGNVQNSKMPYVGMISTIFAFKNEEERRASLGEVKARVMGKFARKTPPEGTTDSMSVGAMWWVIQFMVPAFLKRQHRPHPFFQGDAPIVPARVLTASENKMAHTVKV